jgi:hypothetical protein
MGRKSAGRSTSKIVEPEEIADVKPKRILKKSSKKEPREKMPVKEKWTVAEFLKDAAWFAKHCGLPNEANHLTRLVT